MATPKKTAAKPAQAGAKKTVPASKTARGKPAADSAKKDSRPALKTKLQPDAPWPFPTGKRP